LTIRILDLSHFITSDMPVYPGDEHPVLTETQISLNTHTGTHIDFPSLSDYKVEDFFGTGFIIDCSGCEEGKPIGMDYVKAVQNELEGSEFVLFHTGWDKHWGAKKYFENFPVLSEKLAKYIAGLKIKGAGIDTASFDPVGSNELPVHGIFLERNIFLIENLTGLGNMIGRRFDFACFPLKFKGLDGCPVRAVAI
jgi:arylformamidase